MSGYDSLKRTEKNAIERGLDMGEGYVLDFSNRTIEEYFEDEFNIQFYDGAFGANGNSKANRLRTILGAHSGAQSAEMLRRLWEYRSTAPFYASPEDPKFEAQKSERYFAVVAKLEGDERLPDLSVFSSFEKTDTLYELIQSIERDIRADKPQAAIDRLHLFCVKRFRHLLKERGIPTKKEEPLNSLAGRYKKALEAEGEFSEMALLFIRYSIAVFEKFNDLRNNRSLAHDNELLDIDEARFVFDAISAVLRFIKRVDSKFDA